MIDRIIDLIYLVVIFLMAVSFYRLGKGEKIIEANKIVTALKNITHRKKKFKPSILSWTDEDEAKAEELENNRKNKILTDEEYFELAKRKK